MVGSARTRVPSAVTAAKRPRDPSRRRRALRHAPWLLGLASALTLASPAEAREPSPRDDRPWGRGVLRPTFGLSPWGLFNQDVASLSFGVGLNYFIVNGLSVGLGLSDTVFIYRSAFKARFPGIETALPTNMLEVTPTIQYVFFRSRRFSPYVYAGAGPVFFNHQAGTYGQWVAGPGAYFNVAGPLFVSVGVGFSGLFPTDRCNEALTYQPADPLQGSVVLDLCSFRWGPQVGLGLAFGNGRRGREQQRPPRREPPPHYEPVSNPLDDAVLREPEPEPEPEPVEPAGEDPADLEAPEDAIETPGTEPSPTDVAPPPSDAPTSELPAAPPPSGPAAAEPPAPAPG